MIVLGGDPLRTKRSNAEENMNNRKDIQAEEIYDLPYTDTPEERMELMRHKGGKMRLKTIKSSDILEAEIYPVWDNTAHASTKRVKRSSEDDRKYYDAKRKKYLTRLINTNFTNLDIWATLAYRDGELPESIEAAEHELEKFFRRLAYYAKKHNLPALKYIAVTEELSRDGEVVRVHHHIFINFRDRDMLEHIWGHDDRPNTRRLHADENGYDGAAHYTLKNIKGKKSYRYSQNLKKPTEYIADSKITARTATEMAVNRNYCETKLQKLYKGYELVSVSVRTSEFVSGFYIYSKFRKANLQSTAEDTGAIKPETLSKEQIRRLRKKLSKISALKKEIKSLERELQNAKTIAKKNAKTRITRAKSEISKLTTYFNQITKKVDPSDRALLRDRFINSIKLESLAYKYHYCDKSVVARRIDKILSRVRLR